MGNKNTTIHNNEISDEKTTTNYFFDNKNRIYNQKTSNNNNNIINESKKEIDKPQFLDIFISSQKNNNNNNSNNNTLKNYQFDGNKYWVQNSTYSTPIFNHKEKSAFINERPALRLDSRLVCKYEVLAVIGKGSFSQVFRVKHRITNQFFAVKLVNISSDFSAVNNELSILSKVNHNYVIRLEEVFGSLTKLFIVMEMAAGGEMYDRIVNKGRYSEAEARYAVRMLLSGLCYLHSMHITHRDLKPENLLYSDQRLDAKLLITDFGLANQSENKDELMSETCGTPEYIAPEILLRLPYTNKVDMWAVGVITYILMTGIMPFDDDDRTKLYSHIITADYVYYPMYWSGSELAKEFIDSLLQTNPKQRLCATSALQHDWVLGVNRKNLTNTSENNHRKIQRSKSVKSIRSVTRSDHSHRVDPNEINKLANDLKKLAIKQQKKKNSNAACFKEYNNKKSSRKNYNNYNSNISSTKHYGVF